MLLQRIISSARIGAKGIHPERNVMLVTKRGRGSKFMYATRGDDISPLMLTMYAGIFVVGSLAGPAYFLMKFKELKDERGQND